MNKRPTPETDAAIRKTWPADAVTHSLRLERERDEAREQIQMMLKHDAERLESDSIVGSCDCNVKTNEVKHHKPGCKYRLISERDEAREVNATIQSREAELVLSKDRISKRAEAIRCELVEKEKQLATMREAIGVAHAALQLFLEWQVRLSDDAKITWDHDQKKASEALAKLQPFLKP